MLYPSLLCIMLPGAPGICIGDHLFDVHFDNVQTDDIVQGYHGVVGQDGELLQVEEFVELFYTP